MADYLLPCYPRSDEARSLFRRPVSQDDDFVEDQKCAHRSSTRRHERLLHVAGISDGLVVTAARGRQERNGQPGAAIDDQGTPDPPRSRLWSPSQPGPPEPCFLS